MKVQRLPEVEEYVAAYDRVLRENKAAMLDEAAAVMERYKARGITTITGSGWPLRPLFLSQKHLQFIAHALHQGFAKLTEYLLAHHDDIDLLHEQLPIPAAMYRLLPFEEGLRSPHFLSVLRPDGFLTPERYVLIEPNFGNGSLISNAYTEILYDYFQGSSVFAQLPWDVKASLDRPFQRLLSFVKSVLPADKKRPLVALFAHQWEHQIILSWEERVIQQLYLAQQLMEAEGIEARVVFEDGLVVDDEGIGRCKEDMAEVDCVLQFTIGTSFMDEPERFEEELAHLGGEKLGHAPWIKPLASLCVDKGTLPLMASQACWPFQDADGFQVEIPPTHYPREEDAAAYRKEREKYVLKKSFDGKDTHVGVSTLGRRWNRVLQKALNSKEYIIQEYFPLPRTEMPMCFDGKEIEWVPVRVELSPFIVGGEYAGAIARYAPDAEGLIMSPPPEDMGLTNVFACP